MTCRVCGESDDRHSCTECGAVKSSRAHLEEHCGRRRECFEGDLHGRQLGGGGGGDVRQSARPTAASSKSRAWQFDSTWCTLIRVVNCPCFAPVLPLFCPCSVGKSRSQLPGPPRSGRTPLIVVGQNWFPWLPITLHPRTEGKLLSVKTRFWCHNSNRLNIDL
jgi:hypothetical protein